MATAGAYDIQIRFTNGKAVTTFLIALRELLDRVEDQAEFGDTYSADLAKRVRDAFGPFSESLTVEDAATWHKRENAQ